ncbi:MAG: hypothetical protein OFPI_10940 [Osedax symbiont Rs2]|nr:MAG: hypothetical protein OFPII_17670 [Osedax symbiont Rs1]EPJ53369.1 MAG: hypothetical protein OFPI_10940 [Osedax symbiont Rs2]
MIELWLGIILLTLLAMSFICWPLFKRHRASAAVNRQQENIHMFKQRLAELQQERDQNLLNDQSFAELKLELEKNLLSDATTEELAADEIISLGQKNSRSQLLLVITICVSLPILALGLYAKYGSAEELLWVENKNNSHQLPTGEKPTAEQAIGLLESELQRNPENAEGWYMLAGAYMGTNQFSKGAQAFIQVLEYLPEQSPQYPSVIGQYAQALFFIDNRVTEKVKVQIAKALAIDSSEVVSLGLLGIEAFEQQNYQRAIDFWRQSLGSAEPNAAAALKSGIAKAESELAALGIAVKESKSMIKNKLKVIVDVEITAALKNSLAPDAILFVFARPIGGKIPLAAVKMKVSELPKRIVLDDSLAMMPTAKISLQKKVEVSARISLSGQPQSQKGDYQSEVLVVKVSETTDTFKLLINKVVE